MHEEAFCMMHEDACLVSMVPQDESVQIAEQCRKGRPVSCCWKCCQDAKNGHFAQQDIKRAQGQACVGAHK
eukprot:1160932-Pelagomonas_calceolata.AAC.5